MSETPFVTLVGLSMHMQGHLMVAASESAVNTLTVPHGKLERTQATKRHDARQGLQLLLQSQGYLTPRVPMTLQMFSVDTGIAASKCLAARHCLTACPPLSSSRGQETHLSCKQDPFTHCCPESSQTDTWFCQADHHWECLRE